ncbi:hypothetical protein Zm00014a_032624 [Zea mays]|uniref:Uncharacterized protein n=1 Tax=Zea mays TaxID=4577 RepID=A0A3L6GCW8_MAIZE|nr:hypothetical protein Zm00014a_032624 [Zea mays]
MCMRMGKLTEIA